jgi:hypothetical protein
LGFEMLSQYTRNHIRVNLAKRRPSFTMAENPKLTHALACARPFGMSRCRRHFCQLDQVLRQRLAFLEANLEAKS